MYKGFTPETSAFYWELMFHNERPWFQEHKQEYIRLIKEPMDELAAAVLEEMNRLYPKEGFQIHVARIYRDARRLHGRGPYRDSLWFSMKSWEGSLSGPRFWFEFSPSSYGYGLGFYTATPSQMERYRAYIDANPAPVEALARKLLGQKEFVLAGEDYKRPKGDKGPLLNPWYNKRRVSLECERDFGGKLFDPDFPRKLAKSYGLLMPCYEFFCRFMEESDFPIHF